MPTGTRGEARGAEGTVKPINPAALDAIALNRSGVRSGFDGPWFPPLDPFTPQAPDSTRGRAFDYPYGVNIAYQPRQEPGENTISFEMLRRLAEPAAGGLDLLRLAIETRKDQMKALRWKIVGREKDDDGGPGARLLEQIFRKPDGISTWRNWIGKLLEDHYVIDANAVYIRPSGSGVLFETIDPALIKLLIDNQGRTPVPPLPAYQQVLKGIPSVEYTTEDLAYYMDNPRSNRMYGFSRVEQVVGIVTIALNRQLSVLNYYTSGTVPDMMIGVPDTWNPDQIRQAQEWWDSLLSGNLAERRKARFYPGQMKPFETKTEVLKNEFDEWLARVICYCFSLPVQGLVKETNRATAETAKETAAEEGLEATKGYVQDVIDDLLLRVGRPDLRAAWDDEEIVDAEVKAKVIVSYFGGTTGASKPILTLGEAREMAGLPPATPEQLDELQPPEPEPPPMLPAGAPGAVPASTGKQPPAKGAPPGKPKPGAPQPPAGTKPKGDVAKAARSAAGRSLPAVPTNRKLTARVQRGVGAAAGRVLRAQRKAVVAMIRDRAQKLAKVSEDDINQALRALEDTPWDDDARERLRALIEALATERAQAALDHVGDYVPGTDDAFAALLEQANDEAIAWAEARIGNLITEVSDTTRDAVNELTAAAIRDGLTNDELAQQMADGFGFSDARAQMIARTETANADVAGTMIGFRASGVVTGKSWDPDDDPCPECQANADEGVIALDDVFPSGDDAPPAHPNCECSVLPVVDDSLVADVPAAEDGGEG
jgi:SPP1 gp7 family putative phage head morphogenesis protein